MLLNSELQTQLYVAFEVADHGRLNYAEAVPLEELLSNADLVGSAGRALGTALPNQKNPNPLQQFGRGVHALGKKDVSHGVALVPFYRPREKDRGSLRREFLDSCDQFRAIYPGHHQIAQYEIDPALIEQSQRIL